MIESILIRNFQAHTKLKIELDPGITTIVGPSDVGKSAIIRAFRWAILNQPKGNGFLREGADSVSVKLKVDGHSLIRERAERSNTYTLDGNTLEAFGNEIPSEVSQLLNTNEINFQGQHDSVFWFSESAGEVSRQLNEIVDLGAIDKTLSYLNSQIREASGRVTFSTERLEQAREAYSKLKPVKEADKALRKVEALEDHWQGVYQRFGELGAVQQSAKEQQALLKQREAQLSSASQLQERGEKWNILAEQCCTLELMLDDIYELQEIVQELPTTQQVQDLLDYAKKYAELDLRLQELRDLVTTYRNKDFQAYEKTKLIEAAERELKVALGKRCPLCQQKIS